MKLKLARATVAILALSLLAAGAASAHGPGVHPSGPPTGSPSAANHTVSYSAHCTPAAAGGSIKVQARVLHGARDKTFSAVATAPLAGGPATVTLHRAGKSFVAHGKIPVPSGQAVGPVIVSVTIVYGGTLNVVTCTSQIHLPGADSPDTD